MYLELFKIFLFFANFSQKSKTILLLFSPLFNGQKSGNYPVTILGIEPPQNFSQCHPYAYK